MSLSCTVQASRRIGDPEELRTENRTKSQASGSHMLTSSMYTSLQPSTLNPGPPTLNSHPKGQHHSRRSLDSPQAQSAKAATCPPKSTKLQDHPKTRRQDAVSLGSKIPHPRNPKPKSPKTQAPKKPLRRAARRSPPWRFGVLETPWFCSL